MIIDRIVPMLDSLFADSRDAACWLSSQEESTADKSRVSEDGALRVEIAVSVFMTSFSVREVGHCYEKKEKRMI